MYVSLIFLTCIYGFGNLNIWFSLMNSGCDQLVSLVINPFCHLCHYFQTKVYEFIAVVDFHKGLYGTV